LPVQPTAAPCRLDGDRAQYPFHGFAGYEATCVTHTHGGFIESTEVVEAR